jgi:phosphatidylserine/phosphatidylglycerophosphate/cardiolipin synthase-like enzyme
VAELQAAFLDNWLRTNGSVLHGDAYFPSQASAGSYKAQTFKSSQRGGSESARLMYLLSIASASKSVKLASAYFVPDKLSIDTFLEAAHRGVKIEIIVPGPHIDQKTVRKASRNLNVLNANFAAQQARVFENDKAQSKEITLEALKHQPIWNKVLNKAVTPLKPQL